MKAYLFTEITCSSSVGLLLENRAVFSTMAETTETSAGTAAQALMPLGESDFDMVDACRTSFLQSWLISVLE